MKKLILPLLSLFTIHYSLFAAEGGEPHFISALKSGKPQQVVVFGTSLTKGANATAAKGGGAWAIQLKQVLDQNFPKLVTFTNEAKGGTTSAWGLANIDNAIKHKPNVIFIEFAINDSVKRFNQSPDTTRSNVEGMIKKIKSALPDCEIVLQLTHQATGLAEDAKAFRIDQDVHQQAYRDLAKQYHLILLDNVPAYKAYIEKNGVEAFKTNFAADGVHINAAGVKTLFLPTLQKTLNLPK